jgi:hypothetical protein
VLGDLNDYDPDVPDRDESRNADEHNLHGLQRSDSSPTSDQPEISGRHPLPAEPTAWRPD